MIGIPATLGIIAAAFSGLAITGELMVSKSNNKNDEIVEPPFTSIIMCSLNEERFIEESLQSLLNQNILRKFPDKFEIIVADSQSQDQTKEIASRYAKVIDVPRGKLNARDEATSQAFGDLIVSVDADTIYPENFLNGMIKNFLDPEVIAVTSPRMPDHRIFDAFFVIPNFLLLKMRGSNSAYWKSVYYEVGGFDLGIDQFNGKEILQEEEFNFFNKLQQVGKVVIDFSLGVRTSTRRVFDNEFIDEINEGTRFDTVYV